MIYIFPLVILFVLILVCAALCVQASRKGEGAFGILYTALFTVCLYIAFLFKLGNTSQAVDAFIPFYKIIALREYGYMSILRDLLSFGAPFLLAGFLFIPAFPRSGLVAAFFTGVFSSLLFNVYPLFNGMCFVTDEYLYAGLGLATGASLYSILASWLKKRLPLEKLRLPTPLHKRYLASLILFIAVYIGIALVMVFDYGETYAPIQFFDSETALPDDITLDCALSEDADHANIYIPATSPAEKAAELAQALDIDGSVSCESGTYVAEDETAKLTVTDSGSWVYEYTGGIEGDLSTEESATEAVYSFFKEKDLLTVDLDQVTDIVAHSDSDGKPNGYELYFSTAVNGMPIVGSSTLVVSVRANNTITKIRRYDGDVLASSIVNIISQKKAYEKISAGDCAYTLFAPAVSAEIQSIRIIYMANSSQGYYLPVWMFTCEAQYEDGTSGTFYIYVEAMK